jgi:hypothetical protein
MGSVAPHGLTTTIYFQYGTTTSYGSTTAAQTKTGNTYQTVSANISGLAASTTYHFRMVATNSAGTRYDSDRTFTANLLGGERGFDFRCLYTFGPDTFTRTNVAVLVHRRDRLYMAPRKNCLASNEIFTGFSGLLA